MDTTIAAMSSSASEIKWPARWQCAAVEAVLPHLGSDERLRILLDDPKTAVYGTLIEGYVYVEDGTAMIIYDRSGRPDVFPSKLLSGPVLQIELIRPARRPLLLFEHPDWKPRTRS